MALSTEVDGSKIKMLRKRKVLTQTELGTSEMIKRGLKPISLRTIQKIENDDKYQCSMKWSSIYQQFWELMCRN